MDKSPFKATKESQAKAAAAGANRKTRRKAEALVRKKFGRQTRAA